MNILVTGGSGYIGRRLIAELCGYNNVVNIDIGLFGMGVKVTKEVQIQMGFEELSVKELEPFDAIIHLAGLSNDPMAHFSPNLNFRCNAADTVDLAYKAKKAGVGRFVFASSASVYQGITIDYHAQPGNTDLRPQEPYAISKLMAERGLRCLADSSFDVVILRKGTVGGLSPRMRYDLVLNTMFKSAVTTGEVKVFVDRNGRSVMRPHLDIQGAVNAYQRSLRGATRIENIFSENVNVADLADSVCSVTGARVVREEVSDSTLLRDYVMGGEAVYVRDNIENSVKEMANCAPRDFDNPAYYNIEAWKRWLER